MRVILLIMIGLSLLQADFIKTGDVVKDTVSKLEWQDNKIGSQTTWQGAIDRCEALVLNGHSDWRLPNINELKSLIDRSKSNPAIVEGFKNTSSNLYWSSTTFDSKGYAWFVDFKGGNVYYHGGKGDSYYVRCVRDGQ